MARQQCTIVRNFEIFGSPLKGFCLELPEIDSVHYSKHFFFYYHFQSHTVCCKIIYLYTFIHCMLFKESMKITAGFAKNFCVLLFKVHFSTAIYFHNGVESDFSPLKTLWKLRMFYKCYKSSFQMLNGLMHNL